MQEIECTLRDMLAKRNYSCIVHNIQHIKDDTDGNGDVKGDGNGNSNSGSHRETIETFLKTNGIHVEPQFLNDYVSYFEPWVPATSEINNVKEEEPAAKRKKKKSNNSAGSASSNAATNVVKKIIIAPPSFPKPIDIVVKFAFKCEPSSTSSMFSATQRIKAMVICYFPDKKPSKPACTECCDYLKALKLAYSRLQIVQDEQNKGSGALNMKSHGYRRYKFEMEAILISKEQMTPGSQLIFQSLNYSMIWIFQQSELIRNITEHKAIPICRALSQSEALTFLKQRKFKQDQLPIQLLSDPLGKFYGWPIGTIVHYERRFGGTMPTIDHWRIVKPNARFLFQDNDYFPLATLMLKIYVNRNPIFAAFDI